MLVDPVGHRLLSPSPPPPGTPCLSLGADGGMPVYAALLDTDAVPADAEPADLRGLYGTVLDAELGWAARAVQLAAFDRDHRFCGRCGGATAPSPVEHARVCDACGATAFPRVSPAVIVLVERGDECLLARSPRFPPGMYAAIAGFVEPGETAEHAVERELAEEVGITATAIRYAGSQPWPFPHSLMLGFTAAYAGGRIRADGAEVEDAGWFPADALPLLPAPGSIARRLIDEFRDRVSTREPR